MNINIRPLHNSIIFQFEDEIDRSNNSGFKDVTEGGVFLGMNHERSTKNPRWGKVLAVGNSVSPSSDITVGSRICIEALRWTSESVVDGVSIWRTDEDQVLLVDPN